MELKDKYNKLIDYAQKSQVEGLSVTEKNGILYISGTATSPVKERIWSIYDEIDPDMRSGDLVLDIKEEESDENADNVYEVKTGDNLSKIAKNYPGMTWQKIYEANKDILKDPNVIYPGQKLKIPL
ncbi:LysM peptidoglycan-binding domain-containing protein [Prevotella sp. 10(H)]|uniref:LysM peptidoglycan-binding domain-containing protein n=1 Tax=Prevotella sp. 10(H) TaxID=1158294 RepID=UPI0004A75DAF|nr:LysM peptidoglycan-binding domain-containing protein [Prevotella sp. 10(H)]